MVLLYSAPGTMGVTAADFSLPGVDGKQHALSDYAAAQVLVVMFICNHCPYVQAIEGRLVDLANALQPQGVAFVAISSNDAVSYPEDNMDNMKKRAKERGYPFDYLLDESQDVARAYGAVCTPDFFVYDQERKLRYRGRLDDSPRNPAAVRHQEMKRAIQALLAGEPVPEPQHAAMGCSLKWRD
ncbi:MAG: thioredoxin family protein [Magnetococcales bacterium]|nr:thioredoxin family protein [Magnetococcales bacterium]